MTWTEPIHRHSFVFLKHPEVHQNMPLSAILSLNQSTITGHNNLPLLLLHKLSQEDCVGLSLSYICIYFYHYFISNLKYISHAIRDITSIHNQKNKKINEKCTSIIKMCKQWRIQPCIPPPPTGLRRSGTWHDTFESRKIKLKICKFDRFMQKWFY